MKDNPSYLELYRTGELRKRSERLNDSLSACRLCPRNCGVNRIAGQTGFCRSGNDPVVANYCMHQGEEPVLSGKSGIGNIFFGNCNLRCVYCQNYQISQPDYATWNSSSIEALSDIMMNFQNQGSHLIGCVTPTHFVPQIVSALLLAIPKGFRLPLVYNTNAYDHTETLQLLEGIFDVYLPDLKYANDGNAERYSFSSEYVNYSRKAVREMFRQVGPAIHLNEHGAITRGLIVRHLVLPNDVAGSLETLEWIANHLDSRVTVSVMSQYYPAFRAMDFHEINRTVNEAEYSQVLTGLEKLELENGWIQDALSYNHYTPDFNLTKHPFER